MLFICLVATWRDLLLAGYESWYSLLPLTAVLGFLMNLAESALWDTLEPFSPLAKAGFGAGTRVPVRGERVTAASSIAAGDPTRGAAASAFTQLELDTLARAGIKPWDASARAALKKL